MFGLALLSGLGTSIPAMSLLQSDMPSETEQFPVKNPGGESRTVDEEKLRVEVFSNIYPGATCCASISQCVQGRCGR
jgi:hypothetical protein